jgi:hypothetical protein
MNRDGSVNRGACADGVGTPPERMVAGIFCLRRASRGVYLAPHKTGGTSFAAPRANARPRTGGMLLMGRYRVGLVCGLLVGVASAAAGQQIRSPYRFIDTSQFLGLTGAQVSASQGRLETGPDDAPMVGIRWGLRVSGPFTVGAEVGYMPSTRIVRDTVFVTADSLYRALGEADINVLTILGNLRFNVTGARTWHNLQPFVLFGAGAALDVAGSAPADTLVNVPDARFDFGTSFAGQIGAGVEWFPAAHLSARIDAYNVLWKLKVPEAFGLTERGENFPQSEWEQNFVLSAGLSFHF